MQAEVHRDVDLLKLLPIPKHNELDSGPYITAALLIARNPKTGIQNVSIHRCQISGKTGSACCCCRVIPGTIHDGRACRRSA